MGNDNDIRPLDLRILRALRNKRNVPINLAEELESHRNYISNRLNHLQQHELVRQVGTTRTGLYEITPTGIRLIKERTSDGTTQQTFNLYSQ